MNSVLNLPNGQVRSNYRRTLSNSTLQKILGARESCETDFLCTLFITHFLKSKGVKKIQVISSLRFQDPYSNCQEFKTQYFAGLAIFGET